MRANHIRLFGSNECSNCVAVFLWLSREKIDFEFVDAFNEDDKIQKLCDDHSVDDLPHLQFLNNDEIIFEHIGSLDVETLINYLSTY